VVTTSTVDTSGAIGGGPAGDVVVEGVGADSLVHVTGGGRIDSSSFGRGAGGMVQVRTGEILVAGEGSAIATKASGSGDGGDLELRAERIAVVGGGSVSAESAEDTVAQQRLFEDLVRSALVTEIFEAPATGNAGSMLLVADSILVKDASITAASTQADGGDISIEVGNILHLIDGEITTSVEGGQGGSIDIDPVLVLLENGRIVASAAERGGRGGRVTIETDLFLTRGASEVAATAPGGPEFAGTVEINSPDVDLAGTLGDLPESFFDASALLRERCAGRATGAAAGSFVLRGAGGIGAEPDGLLPAPLVLGAAPAPGTPVASAPAASLAVAAASPAALPGGCW
jgi:hypothetical protein